ncbi:MAG: hypothetical protein IKY52_02690 [Clostridia bacterium]|nr:hypothetical protein [Clostridia bacterium]
MEKSYVRFYALREMRARPKTFLPLFAIFFGVMLLMSNLLIYFQCELTSDAAYYKVETQIILPDLTDDEVWQLRQIDYVKQAEVVPDKNNTYTAYVELTDDRNGEILRIQDSLLDLLDRLSLEERSDPYISFFRWYNDPAKQRDAFGYTTLLNRMYMTSLRDTMFNPGTIMLACIAALMLFAVVVLVYRMKIEQASKEYACLLGMGMRLGQLGKIQYLQGILLLTAVYVPSQLLSMATMKVVSLLSYGIYPEFDGNQALLFDIPWETLGVLYILYLIAVLCGIFLCLHPYRMKTVSAILSGAADRIPFVAKSSVKFLSRGSFEGYGAVWKKRSRRNVWPVMVLFFCLILFPAFLFGGFLTGVEDLTELDDSGSRAICQFNAYGNSSMKRGVPVSLLQDLAEMEEIDSISISISRRSTGMDGMARLPDAYNHAHDIRIGKETLSVTFYASTFLAEEAPESGTVWVPASFPAEVGDTITLTRDSRQVSAVVGRKMEILPAEPQWYAPDTIEYTVILGEDLCTSLCGTAPVLLDEDIVVYSSVPAEKVQSLLDRIAVLTGDTKAYLNDYDRQLHRQHERSYGMRNSYYEHRVWAIKNAFITLFTLAQVVYLMLCAAAVIGSTIDFQLFRRRNEFAVLRALGLADEDILTLGRAYASSIFRWVIPVLYPVMVLLFWTGNADFGFRKDPLTGEIVIGALHALYDGLVYYLITCGILYLLYGGTAWLASRKTVRNMLAVPLAQSVKERE